MSKIFETLLREHSNSEKILIRHRNFKVKYKDIFKSENIDLKKINCGDVGSSTTLSIRPERIHLNSKYKNKVKAKVKQLIYHGDHIRCLLELDKKNNFIVKIPNSNIKNSLKVGEKISQPHSNYVSFNMK